MTLTKERMQEIKDKANEALTKAHINVTPVDIEKIARVHKCEIISLYPTDLPEDFDCPRNDFAGAIIKNIKNKNYIFVNKLDADVRMRFTIAHELGHLLLDHGEKIDCRGKFSSGETQEVEAQEFAGNLLVPEGWLRYVIKNVTTSNDRLVRVFDVSLKVIEIRRRRLGI
ncbi:MAG: ImmA/IrrE family metallo-endopeptidase [Candidatus Magnetoovum sp. WYHC-5]|nr:ImmA/IrrE family metallo-endopeptidase [Candidatus Magnetoovum sp. WYHC-5]